MPPAISYKHEPFCKFQPWRAKFSAVCGQLFAAFVLTAIAVPAAADDRYIQERTVSVSATGYVAAEPDLVRFTVGVVTEAQTAKAALADNSNLFSKVLAGVKSLGIDAKDIATERFQVTPVYSIKKSSSSRTNQIESYRVRNTATLTMRDIRKLGSVIDRATELGANSIGAITFDVSGLETKLDYAREEAMRNAIRRAKLYAAAAGATLAEVLTISEQRHGTSPRGMSAGASSARMAAAVPIEPGEQKLGVTIFVVWKLR